MADSNTIIAWVIFGIVVAIFLILFFVVLWTGGIFAHPANEQFDTIDTARVEYA
jgi:uncharacterized membrane protein (DUF485 family)